MRRVRRDAAKKRRMWRVRRHDETSAMRDNQEQSALTGIGIREVEVENEAEAEDADLAAAAVTDVKGR